jgi:hypothetical protein
MGLAFGIWHPGYGIRNKPIPDLGSRGSKKHQAFDPRPRIRIRNRNTVLNGAMGAFITTAEPTYTEISET